jgi:glutamate--cysteine ligase
LNSTAAGDDLEPLRDLDHLCEIFRAVEKPSDRFRIGAEAEKFAVFRDGRPLDYEQGVTRVFRSLEGFGWVPERESSDGPVIALRRADASITLEPGAQLELSGAALPDLHAVSNELDQHLAELGPISSELGLTWLSVGFHPLASQAELPWVPKRRYAVMKEYLPTRGRAAHDMMRRTATVQANFDFSSEEDALRKLMVSLRLSPLIHALTAYAPFTERRVSPLKSLRGEVWLNMDPARSGLIHPLWQKERPGYRDYAEWALDAGMFLFKRGDRVLKNTGQTFRAFWRDGYEGEKATFGDWRLHLNTLFPEARLKNTLEVRACDAQSGTLTLAVPALFTGILYDERALAEADELSRRFELTTLEAARPGLVRDGLAGRIGSEPIAPAAERLVDIALGGLERRARRDAEGRDERRFLEPLAALTRQAKCPADVALEGVKPGETLSVSELVQRTRLELPRLS